MAIVRHTKQELDAKFPLTADTFAEAKRRFPLNPDTSDPDNPEASHAFWTGAHRPLAKGREIFYI
jgi:hypothetical protein